MTGDINRLQSAVRSLSVLLCFKIIEDFINPALWVLNEGRSVMATVAAMSSSSTALAACWLAASLMVVPYIIMQIWFPDCRHRRKLAQFAIYGMISGGCVWGFMAWLSRNLDYRYVTFNFIVFTIFSIAAAALLANSLNNDQKQAERESQRADL